MALDKVKAEVEIVARFNGKDIPLGTVEVDVKVLNGRAQKIAPRDVIPPLKKALR